MTQSYDRDTRVIRPGAEITPPPSPTAASAGPLAGGLAPTGSAPSATATAPASSEAGGLVAELRPYLPRMALGGTLMLFAEIWWAGRHRRKERKRERNRRRRGRR